MKKFLIGTMAAATLMCGASIATAQSPTSGNQLWVITEGENRMVMGGGMAEGSALLTGENWARPADCPEGAYYATSETTVAACTDEAMVFNLTAAEAGALDPSGQPLPQGAMMMMPNNANTDSGSGQGDGTGAAGTTSGSGG